MQPKRILSLVAVFFLAAASRGQETYPLAEIVAQARLAAASNAPSATGLGRDDYLKTAAGIVSFFQHFQTPAGRIIDPYLHKEVQYSTPCYAWAAAALVKSGRQTNLLESASRALDAALAELSTGHAADGHGDFFTFPCMFAYEALRDRVAPGRRGLWEEDLRAIAPKLSYHDLPGPKRLVHNWNVVALSGEFLRHQDGFCDMDYVEQCLGLQLTNFTSTGQYMDPNVPMAYDHFPRAFLAAILERGYHGAYYPELTNLLERAAWTSLLIQSPRGELPTGGRSAQHQWNEAIQCVTFEIWAARKEREGDHAGARLFKRAARLSLQSIRRWIRPSSELWIVKNYFDPALRHGFQGYSTHSQYNLLTASMMATAWSFADENVPEGASLAETGGFAFELPAFHKVFANAGGLYAEIDTAADPHYNSTGLLRVQKTGVDSLIGPSDNSPALERPAAIGVSWLAGGEWKTLATVRADAQFSVRPAEAGHVAFSIHYTPELSESYDISPERIEVTAEAVGATRMRVQFPALVFDGRDAGRLVLEGAKAVVGITNSTETFEVVSPAGAELRRTGTPISYRNGFLELAEGEVAGDRLIYRITPRSESK